MADGATANTLRAKVTDAFGNALAGQTVSVLADNGATVRSRNGGVLRTVTASITSSRTARWEIGVSPARRRGTSAVTASINGQQPEPERDVYRRCQDGADRRCQDGSLEVTQDNAVADGAMANTLQVR